MPLGVRSKIAFAVGVALARERRRTTSTRSAAQGQDTWSSIAPSRSGRPTRSGPSSRPRRSSTAASTTPCSRSRRRRLASGADGGSRLPGIRRREDVHVRPAPRHPVRRRHADDGRRRRLLVPPPDQPQGQPRVPALGRDAFGARPVHGRAPLEDAEHRDPVDRREHVSRDRELEAGEAARCHRRAQRGQDRQGRAMVQLTGFGGRRKRAVRAGSTTSQIVLDQNPRYWRAKPGGRDPEHGLRHAVHQRSAGPARGRHRPLRAAGARVAGNRRVRVRTQPSTWVFWLFANNNPSISAATSNKRQNRSYALDYRPSSGSPARRDPGKGDHPLDVPRRAAGVGCREPEPHACAQRARSVGCRRADVHARVPERPHDQRRRVRHAGAARAGEPPGHRDQVELAGAPVGTWLDKYRGGRWRSACRCGDRTTPTPPTTSPSCRRARRRARRLAAAIRHSERLAATARVTTNDRARAPIYGAINAG